MSKKSFVFLMFLFSVILIGTLAWKWIKPPLPPEKIDRVASQKTIKIGYLPIAASLPLFVTQEEELWEKGLDIKLIEFKSSNDLAIAGAAGRVDVMATCAVNAVLDTMEVADKSFYAFLCNGYIKGGEKRKSTDYLIAWPGETIDSLKGKTIAFFPGSVSRVFAKLVLTKYGLRPGDYKYVEMSPPEWFAALKSGRISAVNAVEPFASQILKSKEGVILIDGFFADVQQDIPLSAFWFTDGLSKQNQIKIVKSISNSLVFIDANADAAVKHYEKYTSISPEISSEIGLNNWRLTTVSDAEASLMVLARMLKEDDAIKAFPEREWIWKNPLELH
ncbi:MAG: ABC transporter substrate-binding protein [Planctomycetes bacterium]|nr:ABC transporter substrate-binding protein [Planctomycetota bacterium]